MFIVLGPYMMWGILVTVALTTWAAKVCYDRNRFFDPETRREVVLGIIVISLLTGIGGVIAAYLDHPINPDDGSRS